MKSQHLSCLPRQAYRLLATCLLALGGSMTQTSAAMKETWNGCPSSEHALIRAAWPGGSVTGSYTCVSAGTKIEDRKNNQTQTVSAPSADLLTIEVSMDREWRAANWNNRPLDWELYSRIAGQAWDALCRAIKERKENGLIGNRIAQSPLAKETGLPPPIVDLIAAYTEDLLSYFFGCFSSGTLWDQHSLFQPDRPEVFITGKYWQEILLARMMQKQYFSRQPIQDLQKKVTKAPLYRKDWVEYQAERIMSAPDTFARKEMIRRLVTFVRDHEEDAEEDAEEDRAPLFNSLLPMVVYALAFPVDIPEPRGQRMCVNFTWYHWREEVWPNASIMLPAKAIGRGRVLLISVVDGSNFLLENRHGTWASAMLIFGRCLLPWQKMAEVIQRIERLVVKALLAAPRWAGKIVFPDFFNTFDSWTCGASGLDRFIAKVLSFPAVRAGKDLFLGFGNTSDVAIEVVAVSGAVAYLSSLLFMQNPRLFSRLTRLAWCLAGLAVTFEVAPRVWEVINYGKKSVRKQPFRKSRPYSHRRSFFVRLLVRLALAIDITYISYVLLRSLFRLAYSCLCLCFATFPGWQVWFYQQVPDYCIRQPDSKDDFLVSLGGHLGVSIWLLITIVAVRVASIFRDMLEAYMVGV